MVFTRLFGVEKVAMPYGELTSDGHIMFHNRARLWVVEHRLVPASTARPADFRYKPLEIVWTWRGRV
jgi:hypothetical protein